MKNTEQNLSQNVWMLRHHTGTAVVGADDGAGILENSLPEWMCLQVVEEFGSNQEQGEEFFTRIFDAYCQKTKDRRLPAMHALWKQGSRVFSSYVDEESSFYYETIRLQDSEEMEYWREKLPESAEESECLICLWLDKEAEQ